MLWQSHEADQRAAFGDLIMQILITGINFYPEPIGIGKYTGEMAAWLAERGHDVDVITAFPYYPFWKISPEYARRSFHTETIGRVKVHRVPVPLRWTGRVTTAQRVLLEVGFFINGLRYWIPLFWGGEKYDVILAVCPPTLIGIYPWFHHLIHKTPWVIHVQDLQLDAALQLGMLSGSWGRILYKLERWFLAKATRISTITEAMRRRVAGKGIHEERIWLLPNWSDVSLIQPLPKDNRFRRSLGFNEQQTVFMYAGNMGEKQGLELVIEAAACLAGTPEIQFVLAGAGAARAKLENLVREKAMANVHFLAVQPVELLPELLASADVQLVIQKGHVGDLLMPSKLTNIFAAGRPTLATAEEGTELYDVLISNHAGIVTAPQDLASFAEAISKLHKSPELRETLGNNARGFAERFLDREKILSTFEAMLSTLTGK